MGPRFFVLLSALGLLNLGGFTAAPATCATTRDQAIVNFAEPVLVGTQWVMGRAVIVHDDELKAQGEACTFIYTQDSTGAKKLVAAYKCERVPRPTSNEFRLVTQRNQNDWRVLREVQFRGQAYGHEFIKDNAPHLHGGN
jgi:hypothetical protein